MIDAHVHIFPRISGYNGNGFIESLSGGRIRLGTGEIQQALSPAFSDNACTSETLLRYMDWNEIDRAVLLQGNFYGAPNNYLFDAHKKWPDRLSFAGMVDPYSTTAQQQVNYLVEELGCRMLKMECSTGFGLSGIHPSLNYEDEYFSRIFEVADAMGMTIIFDTGLPHTLGYQITALENIIKKYAKVNFVIAHLGFPPGKRDHAANGEEWKKMINIGKHSNVWFDLSSLVGLDGDEYPYPLAQEYIHYAFILDGAKKLIFGTDFPGILTKCTYQQAVSFIRDHCTFLTNDDKKKIFETNAESVYKW